MKNCVPFKKLINKIDGIFVDDTKNCNIVMTIENLSDDSDGDLKSIRGLGLSF